MTTNVVFDLDDTLCDFTSAKKKGLAAAIALLPEYLQATASKRWDQSEVALYRSFASGEIDIDGYRHRRFAALFPAELNSDRLVKEMNAAFMVEVNEKIQLLPGAVGCLQTVQEAGWSCHLLTNGPSDGQNQKIDRLGLRCMFDVIQIGGEVGIFKPDARAFQLLLRTIEQPPGKVVMVGDSWNDDIEPAQATGMQTVHIQRKPETGDISDLAELPELLASF